MCTITDNLFSRYTVLKAIKVPILGKILIFCDNFNRIPFNPEINFFRPKMNKIQIKKNLS